MTTRGKREILSALLYASGSTAILRAMQRRDILLILNYHRIGNRENDPYDPGVFSATAEEFDEQLAFLKRHFVLVNLDEAIDFALGKEIRPRPKCRVLITFDDGYLDNYQLAAPILRAHGAQGVFFLPTAMVGSCQIPWWDRIAYIVRTARRRAFQLSYPTALTVDLDRDGLYSTLRHVLNLYKRPENNNPDRFLAELQDATGGDIPPEGVRRFLDWSEAAQMLASGMAIGSHCHSHTVLSQLPPEVQREEFTLSRALFKKHLGTEVDTLAYPVGQRTSFTQESQRLARECGYRAAFSFYGGISRAGRVNPYDISRVGVDGVSRDRLRTQTSVCAATGKYWP